MSARTIRIDDRLYDYIREVMVPDDPVLADLRARTAALPQAGMQISPEQGRFLGFLVGLMGAANCLEIGTFTGYSALSMARAMRPGGRLVCCDVSQDWTAIARDAWARAGVAEHIDLRIGPALDTLAALVDDGAAGRFDLAFIDADKENYAAYYETCLTLVRPGGVVAVDNVLWGGSVADPGRDTPETEAIRALNRAVFGDARVDACLVPIGDGLTLARKL